MKTTYKIAIIGVLIILVFLTSGVSAGPTFILTCPYYEQAPTALQLELPSAIQVLNKVLLFQ